MTRGQSGQAPELWRPFEQVARAYETWYETRRGQRADQAERVLLEWLVGPSPGAETLLEVWAVVPDTSRQGSSVGTTAWSALTAHRRCSRSCSAVIQSCL